jgi:hypothetical protein
LCLQRGAKGAVGDALPCIATVNLRAGGREGKKKVRGVSRGRKGGREDGREEGKDGRGTLLSATTKGVRLRRRSCKDSIV